MTNWQIIIFWYFSTSFGFYLGAACVNLKSFKNTSLWSRIKGFFGCLLWPVFIAMIFFYGTKGLIKSWD